MQSFSDFLFLKINSNLIYVMQIYVSVDSFKENFLGERTFKVNESQYIALLKVSRSIKNLFSIVCVNIYFSQSIVNYFFSIIFSIDLEVWGYPTLLMDMFFFECTKFTLFYIVTFTSINGNLIKLQKKTKMSQLKSTA